MGTIPPHIAITYQPKSVYELGKRGVPSARPSTTISPDTCKPMTQPLSPAAQAVLDAANQAYWLWDQMHPADADAIAAAALRALADQGENLYDPHDGKVGVVRIDDILAIATELEAHHG